MSPELTAPAIDPTLLAILSIFGGAALTVLAGIVGAFIQARREHRTWLREKRYDAFVELRRIYLELADIEREQELAGMVGDVQGIERQIQRRAHAHERLRRSMGELYVAPKTVKAAAAWYHLQMSQSHDRKQREDAERALEQTMLNALNVRD